MTRPPVRIKELMRGKAYTPRPEQGKRGGWRIVFADYPDLGVAVLVAAYPKNLKGDLSSRERNALKLQKPKLDADVESTYGPKKPFSDHL